MVALLGMIITTIVRGIGIYDVINYKAQSVINCARNKCRVCWFNTMIAKRDNYKYAAESKSHFIPFIIRHQRERNPFEEITR